MSDTNFLTVKNNGRPWGRRRASDDGKWGPIDVEDHTYLRERHNIDLHVFLNGDEVTDNCLFADDVVGLVIVYARDLTGKIRMDWDDPSGPSPIRVPQFGHVVIAEHPSQEDYDAGNPTPPLSTFWKIVFAACRFARGCGWQWPSA